MLILEQLNKFQYEDRIITLTGASWSDYATLNFPDSSSYLISYLNHEITIMSPGRNHERISRLLNILVADYCLIHDIPCFFFGSNRLKVEGLEGKEPDEAFVFHVDKPMPDLAIEVNFTSGNLQDLTKYQYLQINEVWIYQNQQIKFYTLLDSCYQEIQMSTNLKKINSQVLTSFVNRGLVEDTVTIRKEFQALF